MTTIDTDRRERGRRSFAGVMTFPAPEASTPVAANMLDFVFAEVWDATGTEPQGPALRHPALRRGGRRRGAAARSCICGAEQR